MGGLLHDSVTRFVAQLIVILAAARVLGLIARRIGQPQVVAEIIVGVVLGPSVVGRLAPGPGGFACRRALRLRRARPAGRARRDLFTYLGARAESGGAAG